MNFQKEILNHNLARIAASSTAQLKLQEYSEIVKRKYQPYYAPKNYSSRKCFE